MAASDYDSALEEFERMGESEDDVLYLLERGLLLHYAGQYNRSNEVFERAEILSEDLYTRSISREAAAFLTSNLALEYVPKPFEQVLINYFRALNYLFIGSKDDALVECRKAGEKLVLHSEEDTRAYRHDAFLEYLTGILYEWDEEINDAFISYRSAASAYNTYSELFRISRPPDLACDVIRTARLLSFTEEDAMIDAQDVKRCERQSHGPDMAKIVIFLEQGFVPAKEEWSLNVPILKSEAKKAGGSPYEFSLGAASRLHGHAYGADEIAYFLRVALPHYPEYHRPSPPPAVLIDSLSIVPDLCEDVFAIAKAELDHDMPKIFAKTLARAILKYKATDKAEDKWGDLVGKVVNIATAATERADLRAWLSLPRAIHITIAYVEAGEHMVRLRSPDSKSAAIVSQAVLITAGPGSTNFVRFRTY
jgi:hypothetical protein